MTAWGIWGGWEHASPLPVNTREGWAESESWSRSPDWTPAEVTLDTLTHTHRKRGPGPVDALGRGHSVLVLVSWVAAHPDDLALLVPAAGHLFVGPLEDSWRTAVVLIWQTEYLIFQNGSMRNRSQFHQFKLQTHKLKKQQRVMKLRSC